MSSSDDKATPAEPETSTLAKSFEDRLSFPSDSKTKAQPADLTTSSSGKFNWADEVETPIEASDKKLGESEEKEQKESSVGMAQTDGSSSWLNGSAGLDEPEFDVNVKLADLQEDPNNPLYSVKSFAELNL